MTAPGSTRVEVRTRRRFTIDDKRRIVAAYRQIDDGTLGTTRPGPAPTGRDQAKVRVRELEAQLKTARSKIATLEELVTAQGKCLALHVDVRLDDSATSPTR